MLSARHTCVRIRKTIHIFNSNKNISTQKTNNFLSFVTRRSGGLLPLSIIALRAAASGMPLSLSLSLYFSLFLNVHPSACSRFCVNAQPAHMKLS